MLQDAMTIFSNVKVDLAMQINVLTNLKQQCLDSNSITTTERSKAKIMIESLLIDLNEEMYELSEELSKSFLPEK